MGLLGFMYNYELDSTIGKEQVEAVRARNTYSAVFAAYHRQIIEVFLKEGRLTKVGQKYLAEHCPIFDEYDGTVIYFKGLVESCVPSSVFVGYVIDIGLKFEYKGVEKYSSLPEKAEYRIYCVGQWNRAWANVEQQLELEKIPIGFDCNIAFSINEDVLIENVIDIPAEPPLVPENESDDVNIIYYYELIENKANKMSELLKIIEGGD
jgi:hypothetical protein